MGRPAKYLVGTNKERTARKERKIARREKAEEQVAPVEQTKPIDPTPVISEEKVYTQQEIAKLIADFTKNDPYNLKGLNPRFRYRFLNRASDKLDRQTMRGWEIVTGPEADRIAKASKISLRQGQITVGDGVLARIPMEVYVAIQKKLQDLNKRVIGQSTKTLRRDMGSKYSRNVEESLKVRDRGAAEETVL